MKKTKKAAPKKAVKKAPAKKAPAKKAAAKKAAPQKTPVKAAPPPKLAPGGPLSKQEIADIAASLSEMKADIAKNVEDKKNLDLLEPEVGDSIDQATQSLDKEILFELSDNERKILGDIDAALRKMDKGTYGLCEHCKKHIEKKRIKALPSARYCMACQSGSERSRF
ncbi:MAG: TraR/DksA family transcriptional regulator [Elusimicrobiales bacterium]